MKNTLCYLFFMALLNSTSAQANVSSEKESIERALEKAGIRTVLTWGLPPKPIATKKISIQNSGTKPIQGTLSKVSYRVESSSKKSQSKPVRHPHR